MEGVGNAALFFESWFKASADMMSKLERHCGHTSQHPPGQRVFKSVVWDTSLTIQGRTCHSFKVARTSRSHRGQLSTSKTVSHAPRCHDATNSHGCTDVTTHNGVQLSRPLASCASSLIVISQFNPTSALRLLRPYLFRWIACR